MTKFSIADKNTFYVNDFIEYDEKQFVQLIKYFL